MKEKFGKGLEPILVPFLLCILMRKHFLGPRLHGHHDDGFWDFFWIMERFLIEGVERNFRVDGWDVKHESKVAF